MGPGGEGAFPSVAAADVPLPTAGPSTVAAALPHAVYRTALGSEARQGGHGHDARGCWGRHQHASAGREYARLDGRTRCRTGQDGGHGGWEGAKVSPGRWEGVTPAGWWQQQEVPRRVWGEGALVSPPGSRRCWGATAQPRAPPGPGVPQGYTPLHIAALHGHRQIVELLIERFGAKQNLRDYSGHLAGHYLGSVGTLDGDPDTPQLPSGRGERGRNRRLGCLLLPKAGGAARRRWGSAEDLAQLEEERAPAQLLAPPASYRAVRKFSR
uniref:Ankyrin repeat domain-containing protein SOWAHD n=1 Tax=Anas platyrhynchos TaxID=8839 RepID=A0A8B9SUL5_ANAPL